MRKTISFLALMMLALCASAQGRLQEAVDFLYRYMPAADKANYDERFFREQARYALYARTDLPWEVPDSLWLHFVLPPRVNNEELDDFRKLKYIELRRRVERLTMREAALEVNHWCHEYVTYRPSDSRTSSPLATIKTGYGRCGEESVLAVAAMRAVGIPARQVYTPRWAHTDNNHAWIEVWVDGKWYFMGACEPEPVLNMAWFNSTAARALLMHTQVFGDWHGPEEVIQRNECFTEINCITGYVPTRRNTITVVDEDGAPVADALVEFKIYNYGEFCTVVTVRSDAEGHASLTVGKGDMLVWASKDGRFGYAKMNGDDVRVALTHTDGDRICEDIDIVPPAEGMIPVDVTDEQVAANKRRLVREDTIRMKRLGRNDHLRTKLVRRLACDSTETALLAKSEGNVMAIGEVMGDKTLDRSLAKALLLNLTDKDLRDVSAFTLRSYLRNAPVCRVDSELYAPYVLSPRIETEPLRPFVVPESMRTMIVGQVLAWTRDSIRIVSNPRSLRFAPQAVYDGRQADERSRSIFFVALCRANGIPARIESVSGRTEYHSGDAWLAVSFRQQTEEVKAVRKGKMRLNYKPTDLHPDLDYYRHFSITKIDNGVGTLQNYEEGDAGEDGTQMTALRFSSGQPMAEGYYLVTTGSRMSSGKVLVHMESCIIRSPRTTGANLALREGAPDEVTVKGYFDADPLLPQTGRGYFLMMIGGKHDEPTNHARIELKNIQKFLTQWGRPVLQLDGDEYAALADELRRSVKSRQKTLPVVVIADSFGRIVFYSEGYNTSLGEQLKRTITNL